VAFEFQVEKPLKFQSTPRCIPDLAMKNEDFAAIFWLNHGVRHRSPFAKVGAG
jgi:hypothetical protein